LTRRRVALAAEDVGARFPEALEGDAVERAGVAGRAGDAVVLRRDADDDARVGIALVARVLAHAVGDDAARLRSRGDDRAAGAHAEAVDRAAVLRVVHELVVGGAEERMAGVLLAEAGAGDQPLRMLDAKADGERLGVHRDGAR